MIVYRLENKEKYGPFHATLFNGQMFLHEHNEPYMQFKAMRISDNDLVEEMLSNRTGIFGWLTYDQFQQFIRHDGWVPLHMAGFELVEYNTFDYVIFPDGQVIFDKGTATEYDRRSLIDVMEDL